MSVALLWGEDPFLLREAALELVGVDRPIELDAAAWRRGELRSLASPSLFGEPRVLLLTGLRELDHDQLGELRAYLEAPDPDARVVLCWEAASARGRPPAWLVRLAEAGGEVRQVALARRDLEPWLTRRAAARGARLTGPAARALVETIGADTAQLAAAVEQLADAYGEATVGPREVHAQFRGLGEQKTWDLCDRAFARDLPGAMRALRSIEETGADPLLVLGGIASRLRELIRVRSLPDRLPPRELAERAGLRFEWQARRLAQEARGYALEDLVRLHARVVEADRALKSGGSAEVVLPLLVVAIATEGRAA
jgi:DNA polymerase-3 subunit delta